VSNLLAVVMKCEEPEESQSKRAMTRDIATRDCLVLPYNTYLVCMYKTYKRADVRRAAPCLPSCSSDECRVLSCSPDRLPTYAAKRPKQMARSLRWRAHLFRWWGILAFWIRAE
jgi:hypothetical protein